MRLKGGRVLLDVGELVAKEISLSNQEIKAILEKGLSIHVIEVSGLSLVIDLIPSGYDGANITYPNFTDSESVEFGFILSIESNLLTIS